MDEQDQRKPSHWYARLALSLASETQAGKPMSGLRSTPRFLAAGGRVVIEGGGPFSARLAYPALLAALLLPAFIAYMTQYQIKPEERALCAKFGPEYAQYISRVRRWL